MGAQSGTIFSDRPPIPYTRVKIKMCISPKVNIKLNTPVPLKVYGASDKAFQLILKNSNDQVERLQQQRLQAFLDDEPEFHADMEIDHLRFSEHLFEFKFGLEHLAEKQTLKVSSKSQLVTKELAATCRVLKLPVEARQFRKKHFLYATRPLRASVHLVKPKITVATDSYFKLAAP